MIAWGLWTFAVILVLLLVFKCSLVGHVWLEYVHGRSCVWCNKYERRGQ